MARVKMLRRLCARFATRAKTRAGRRRHLDCSASIRLPAALKELESKMRQRTISSSSHRESPQWQGNITAELARPPRSKFPTAYPIWVLIILFALITFLTPLTRRHASSRKCLASQGPRSRSSASKSFTSQPRPLFLPSWRSSVPPPLY